MNKLERQHLADYLKKYNEWRRDPRTPSGIKMPNPTELGMMIDLTIKELRGTMENTDKTGFISLKEQHAQQKEKATAKDNINPDHYKVGGIETWDYLKAKLTPSELAGAVKFNVIKYVSRCEHKGKVEDLKKAAWYLNNLIAEIEKGNAPTN